VVRLFTVLFCWQWHTACKLVSVSCFQFFYCLIFCCYIVDEKVPFYCCHLTHLVISLVLSKAFVSWKNSAFMVIICTWNSLVSHSQTCFYLSVNSFVIAMLFQLIHCQSGLCFCTVSQWLFYQIKPVNSLFNIQFLLAFVLMFYPWYS